MNSLTCLYLEEDFREVLIITQFLRRIANLQVVAKRQGLIGVALAAIKQYHPSILNIKVAMFYSDNIVIISIRPS